MLEILKRHTSQGNIKTLYIFSKTQNFLVMGNWKNGNFEIIGHEVEGENKKGKTTFIIEARIVREMSVD